MSKELRLVLSDAQDAVIHGWVNEYRPHPQDATRLVLDASLFPQVAAQYPVDTPHPPTPPTWPVNVPGFDKTICLDMPWATSTGWVYTNGFDGNTAVVVRFTVPASYSSSSPARINGSEYGGGPVIRYSTLSTKPGDFSSSLPAVNVLADTPTVLFWLQVGGSSDSRVVLQRGQTYYLNIRNTDSQGRNSCMQGFCEMGLMMMVP